MLRALLIFSLLPGLVWAGEMAHVGHPVIYTEDPVIDPVLNLGFHATVEHVYFDDGECVAFINFPDGATEAYEGPGGLVQKLTLSDEVRNALPGEERTLFTIAETNDLARRICWPEDPVSADLNS